MWKRGERSILRSGGIWFCCLLCIDCVPIFRIADFIYVIDSFEFDSVNLIISQTKTKK